MTLPITLTLIATEAAMAQAAAAFGLLDAEGNLIPSIGHGAARASDLSNPATIWDKEPIFGEGGVTNGAVLLDAKRYDLAINPGAARDPGAERLDAVIVEALALVGEPDAPATFAGCLTFVSAQQDAAYIFALRRWWITVGTVGTVIGWCNGAPLDVVTRVHGDLADGGLALVVET